MGKVKKISKQKSSNKAATKQQKSVSLEKLFERFEIKDCRVVLNSVTTRQVNIKLNKNSLNFNGKSVDPTPADSNSNGLTFNLTYNVKLNQLIDQCNVVTTTKAFAPKSLAAESDCAWRAAKKCHGNTQLVAGQIVVSKMRSYAPWPAQIRTFSKNFKRAEVFFFGTDNTGMVDVQQSVDIASAREVMRLLLLRQIPLYAKAVREAERVCGVPDELSLLRETAKIDY